MRKNALVTDDLFKLIVKIVRFDSRHLDGKPVNTLRHPSTIFKENQRFFPFEKIKQITRVLPQRFPSFGHSADQRHYWLVVRIAQHLDIDENLAQRQKTIQFELVMVFFQELLLQQPIVVQLERLSVLFKVGCCHLFRLDCRDRLAEAAISLRDHSVVTQMVAEK